MSARGKARLRCLWLDLKASVMMAETPAVFEQHCDVIRGIGLDEGSLMREDPDFVVLEFDYPSRYDLARAVPFKKQFAHTPMIVVTVQHSEALSLWFFRTGFYDYLVQPLVMHEVSSCLGRLVETVRLASEQPTRRAVRIHMEMPHEAGSQAGAPARLQPALTLVERDYHRRLLVTEAAKACGLPDFRFGREFKEQFGIDFRDYLLRYRIREACRLLRNPNASVTEVGYSVGFTEPSYFTKMFKKLLGRLPSEVLGVTELDFNPRPLAAPRAESANYQRSFEKS